MKEPEATVPVELQDPEKLEIPRDNEACDRIAIHWEKYGFGRYQVHWDNQGRSPVSEMEIRENRISRNIRQRFWKIWKRSNLDELSYKIVTDAVKGLARVNVQNKFADKLTKVMEDNLVAMTSGERDVGASVAAAPPVAEGAAGGAPVGVESSAEAATSKNEVTLEGIWADAGTSGNAAPPGEVVDVPEPSNPPTVWFMESFSETEMASATTEPAMNPETAAAQDVRVSNSLTVETEVRIDMKI